MCTQIRRRAFYFLCFKSHHLPAYFVKQLFHFTSLTAYLYRHFSRSVNKIYQTDWEIHQVATVSQKNKAGQKIFLRVLTNCCTLHMNIQQNVFFPLSLIPTINMFIQVVEQKVFHCSVTGLVLEEP